MIDKNIKFISINIAILTISDSRNLENDESGKLLAGMLKKHGNNCVKKHIVKDDSEGLLKLLDNWTQEKEIDVIITTGGTGLTGRDITTETVNNFFEKKIDGFGELFRWISYEKIGTSTIQSRAVAGTKRGKYIFCLP